MQRILFPSSLAVLTVALGCSGKSSPVLNELAQASPTLQTIGEAVTPDGLNAALTAEGQHQRQWGQRDADGDREGYGRRGHRGGGHFMKLLEDDCADKQGDPKSGGSVTFNGCEVRGGTLTGTVTWSGDTDASEDGFATSSTKQLTYVKTDSEGGLPELGQARHWAEDLDIDLIPENWDQATVSSSMAMSGTKGSRDSFTRTGTTDIVLFYQGATVRTINIQMNAPVSATITVDGQTYNVDLSAMREKFKARMQEFKANRGNGEHRKRQSDGASLESDSTPAANAELTSTAL